jgi:hypothetical protein
VAGGQSGLAGAFVGRPQLADVAQSQYGPTRRDAACLLPWPYDLAPAVRPHWTHGNPRDQSILACPSARWTPRGGVPGAEADDAACIAGDMRCLIQRAAEHDGREGLAHGCRWSRLVTPSSRHTSRLMLILSMFLRVPAPRDKEQRRPSSPCLGRRERFRRLRRNLSIAGPIVAAASCRRSA